MCLFWTQKLSAAISQKYLRAIHNNIHCSMWVSKGQRLVQLLCDQHSKHECFGRIRQGLLEAAVLRLESFPSPLRLHSECSLKPSHGIHSAIASEKVSSWSIVHLARIEDLLPLKDQRQIFRSKQHYSVACPWGFVIRHRCTAPACGLGLESCAFETHSRSGSKIDDV